MSAIVHVLGAAEPSKLVFYVAGALLSGWAVVLAAFGLRRADFPASLGGSRAVMGVSALLMVAVMFTAVATASRPSKGEGREQPPGKQAEPLSGGPGRLGGTSGGGGAAATPAQTGQAPAGGGAGAGGGAKLQVAADPSGQLAFEQKSLTAKAGTVTVEFTNRSQVPHNVTIEQGRRKLGATQDITASQATATVKLAPGRYTFFCSVDGHRQAGMQGQLTVR